MLWMAREPRMNVDSETLYHSLDRGIRLGERERADVRLQGIAF